MNNAAPQKLDARVATEIMGWHKKLTSTDHNAVLDVWIDATQAEWTGRFVHTFKPSTSLDACAIAERKMAEMGLRREYVEAVQATFGASNAVLHPDTKLYRLLTASAHVRARAMLAAKGEK